MLLLRLKARLSDIGVLYHNRLYNTNASENKGGYIGLSPETLFTPIAKARGTQALLLVAQEPDSAEAVLDASFGEVDAEARKAEMAAITGADELG